MNKKPTVDDSSRRKSMPAKQNDTAMVRKNYHFPEKQIERLTKLAQREGTSVASLLREGGDMLIADRVEKLKAAKA
jgi:hypothetical protein